jgi:hypothetical protein
MGMIGDRPPRLVVSNVPMGVRWPKCDQRPGGPWSNRRKWPAAYPVRHRVRRLVAYPGRQGLERGGRGDAHGGGIDIRSNGTAVRGGPPGRATKPADGARAAPSSRQMPGRSFLTADSVLCLQRTAGNSAVTRLLGSPRPAASEPASRAGVLRPVQRFPATALSAPVSNWAEKTASVFRPGGGSIGRCWSPWARVGIGSSEERQQVGTGVRGS